ncbi:MAG: Adenylosuccinate lyase @ SAICAR lyase [uncultured Acidimicrobiales bacterium]|uniref:Adenylosuccinate lyase n=1 Tax=uncultured Acidimicrobiales bacterium TaxID=310071 RepID=A0A6J4JG25_9ACTN|nr:MAG: Adenylosuccinate lyase @ SAICAR lyase [uncultured Acidimicrobiales bacterium]
MSKPAIPNVLAARYASQEMCRIWSPEQKVVLERRFWIAVLRAQRDLGVAVADGAVEAYEAVVERVDLESIAARERVTKHDVKARIEELNSLAGFQEVHKGLTSRDLTENVEQLQVRVALSLVRDRMVAALARLAERAGEHAATAITGRSHNVPAQVTTVGKRLANAGEELLQALLRIEELLARYPLRGVKGPVGTQQDLLDLFSGDVALVEELEQRVAAHLGFERVLGQVGQVYPRSLDLDVVAALVQAASGPANLAVTIRLMAGAGLATEGFLPGQVGSSAMPHKQNARSSERITALAHVLGGHLAMVTALVGDQWNEGDVSCSAVRRVALPDASFAIDGLLETFLAVLRGFAVHHERVTAELERELPFLATTKLLLALVKRGVGREDAHAAVKEHALASRGDGPAFLALLAGDPRINFSALELTALIGHPIDLAGAAPAQVASFVARVDEVTKRHPEAAAYQGADVL